MSINSRILQDNEKEQAIIICNNMEPHRRNVWKNLGTKESNYDVIYIEFKDG